SRGLTSNEYVPASGSMLSQAPWLPMPFPDASWPIRVTTPCVVCTRSNPWLMVHETSASPLQEPSSSRVSRTSPEQVLPDVAVVVMLVLNSALDVRPVMVPDSVMLKLPCHSLTRRRSWTPIGWATAAGAASASTVRNRTRMGGRRAANVCGVTVRDQLV